MNKQKNYLKNQRAMNYADKMKIKAEEKPVAIFLLGTEQAMNHLLTSLASLVLSMARSLVTFITTLSSVLAT